MKYLKNILIFIVAIPFFILFTIAWVLDWFYEIYYWIFIKK